MASVLIPTGFPETLRAAQTGSGPALSSLYVEMQPEILAFLRARAPRDADDLSSEVWLDVTRGIGRFEGDATGFRAWVFTIARRRLIDSRRRFERRPTTPLAEIDGEASEHGPETTIVAASSARELLAGLPKDQADVVRLRVVDGLSVDEAAARLGKRPGTVRVLQHRGLRRLATILAAGAAAFALFLALGIGGALPERAEALARQIVDRVGLDVLLPAEPDATSSRTSPAPPVDGDGPRAAGGGSAGAQSAFAVEPETTTSDASTSVAAPDAVGDNAGGGGLATTPPDAVPPAPPTDPPPAEHGNSSPPPVIPPDAPPGLNGAVPPGQGGTPPGHGGVPPGQAKKT